MISLQILLWAPIGRRDQRMISGFSWWLETKGAFLITGFHHLALLRLPTGPQCSHYWPRVVFGAWQDLAGQTLTRPFHARPRKCHLAGVNDYQSNGRVTCSQQESRSLHLSASHFPCPLFISLQVNYSSCTTWEAQKHCTNTKKLHTQFTDIITSNEKIDVLAWTEKTNSWKISTQSKSLTQCEQSSCNDFTPPETGSNHDWMRNKWINWFLTHVAGDVTFKATGAFCNHGLIRRSYWSCWQSHNVIKSAETLRGFSSEGTEFQQRAKDR